MDFRDIILQELATKDEESLNEDWFLTTPFIAFASFKKSVFNRLLKSKAFRTLKDIKSGETLNKIKAGYEIAKEKVKHEVGLVSGKDKDATVYRLTDEQLDIMADIYNKYGNKIVEEIYQFRKNVLAPYQAVKRSVKKNKQISFKDAHGLSYEEYKAALESGRKKILRRKDFFDKNDATMGKHDEYAATIDDLEELKKGYADKKELSDALLNKVYQSFEVSDDDLGGYTPEELKSITDELASNFTKIKRFVTTPNSETPPEEIIAAITRNIALRTGETSKVQEKDVSAVVKNISQIKKGSFPLALSKYLFRKEIRDKIKASDSNVYKEMYASLIDETIKKIRERKGDALRSSIASKMSIEFNEKEAKVWELLPSVKNNYSGDIKDYRQKITDDTFKDVAHIQKPEGLEKAQQEIENEIKRFERKLAQILDAEDLAKLKKYRLINNLITVREIASPDQLFKSSTELKKDAGPAAKADDGADNADDAEGADKTNGDYVSEDEFHRRLKEYATMEYDTMTELNNAKKQASELVAAVVKQGDQQFVKKYANIIRQVKERRSTEPAKLHGSSFTYGEILTINDIENFAKNILKKKYKSVDEMKQDQIIYNKMVDKYKKEEPEAERNLAEIDFILSQVENKIRGALGRYFGEE